ncbi:7338_t:CDS:2 [Entrophospora sp. SA101]|nr:7338_t:CDS:2 [Entrophospora sp. SA101]CAJ0845463.1 9568_t:CDS:2 [Entrophospora sp. SA101]CAJ0845497.1 9580_t:CDS:2 [Entrophospora sp. SA101]
MSLFKYGFDRSSSRSRGSILQINDLLNPEEISITINIFDAELAEWNQ